MLGPEIRYKLYKTAARNNLGLLAILKTKLGLTFCMVYRMKSVICKTMGFHFIDVIKSILVDQMHFSGRTAHLRWCMKT